MGLCLKVLLSTEKGCQYKVICIDNNACNKTFKLDEVSRSLQWQPGFRSSAYKCLWVQCCQTSARRQDFRPQSAVVFNKKLTQSFAPNVCHILVNTWKDKHCALCLVVTDERSFYLFVDSTNLTASQNAHLQPASSLHSSSAALPLGLCRPALGLWAHGQ